MKDRIKRAILRLLRVPPEPSPPAGAPGSLRVFRAARRYWHLLLLNWSGKQFFAAIGILISVAFIQEAEWQQAAAEARAAARAATSTNAAAEGPSPGDPEAESAPGPTEADPPVELPERTGLARLTPHVAPWFFFSIARGVPPGLLTWLRIGEVFAITGFLLQLPFTLVMLRLDYAYRWYLVTDRSLRIRHGILTVHETTMSFANLQQVEIRQDPLQRLFGLADLRVRSAGGGDGGENAEAESKALHQSRFHGVDNATEIRDLILARLRRYRTAGLGDTDEKPARLSAAPATAPAEDGLAEAARALLEEARALRRTVQDSP